MATPWKDIKRKRQVADINDDVLPEDEKQRILDGEQRLPRKVTTYDVVMVVIFLFALAAIVVSLGWRMP